jgi:hypothetical protein
MCIFNYVFDTRVNKQTSTPTTTIKTAAAVAAATTQLQKFSTKAHINTHHLVILFIEMCVFVYICVYM